MVGCVTGRGYPNPVSGVGVSLGERRTGTMAGDTGRGIHQPLKRGWITPSPVASPLWYRGLCLHQPLSGVALRTGHDARGAEDTGRGIHQPLKRGWNTPSPVAIPLWYRGLCLHQPLSGVALRTGTTHGHDARGSRGVGHGAGNTPTPETGLDYPFPCR